MWDDKSNNNLIKNIFIGQHTADWNSYLATLWPGFAGESRILNIYWHNVELSWRVQMKCRHLSNTFFTNSPRLGHCSGVMVWWECEIRLLRNFGGFSAHPHLLINIFFSLSPLVANTNRQCCLACLSPKMAEINPLFTATQKPQCESPASSGIELHTILLSGLSFLLESSNAGISCSGLQDLTVC